MGKRSNRGGRLGLPVVTSRVYRIIAVVLLSIIALLSIFGIIGMHGLDENVKYAQSIAPIATRYTHTEIDGKTTFSVSDDFKVLYLSDIHIGAGPTTIETDRMAMDAIVKLAQFTQPDLIVVTGDIAYSMFFRTLSVENYRQSQLFTILMQSIGIPYAITFGNHDGDKYAAAEKKKLAELYENAEHSLFKRGEKGLSGYGNYIVDLKNGSGYIYHSLVMMDSHSYLYGCFSLAYDNIHDNQVDWYAREMTALQSEYSQHTSTMYMHIPQHFYRDAWDEYIKNGESDILKYYYGGVGEPNGKVGGSLYNGKLFDKMLELKDTNGVFVGHSHLNDFSIEYKGIRLTFAKTTDYTAYAGNAVKNHGGVLVTTRQDSSIDIEPIILSDIK